MSKVLVNQDSLAAIADAIRAKDGSTDKMLLSEMAPKIAAIKSGGASDKNDFWDKYFSTKITETGKSVVSNTPAIREGAMSSVAKSAPELEEITFTNVTTINADCGAVENGETGKNFTVIFKKPVAIKEDAFEYASHVTYRFEGGITSISSNCMYNVSKVTLEIVGDIPKGKPWGGSTKQITVKSIAPPSPVEPKTEPKLLGSATVNAAADGKLNGYTLMRLEKKIPNHKNIKFEVVLSCPTGVTIGSEGLSIGDFKSGRAWSNKNNYASPAAFTKKTNSSGTTYTLSWEEEINESSYLWDDDESSDLLTYYVCSESSVSGSGRDKATLTVNVYEI